MRQIFIIIFVTLISCSSKNGADSVESCPTFDFSKKVDKYDVRASYADCEPDWKLHLKILNGDKVVFKADSLMEFEFNDRSWPDFLKISDTKDQILLEVNDRPNSNYILCITLDNNTVVSASKFHSFDYEPKDFDNDGQLEYAGYPYTVEGYTNDSTYYNPIQYVEKGLGGFRVDTTLTRQVNLKFYGEFPGHDSKIYRKVPVDTVEKYLNAARN
jgi:hypothetical protein